MATYGRVVSYRFGLIVLAFSCMLYLCYDHFNSKYQNEKWVAHTYQVLLHTSKMKFHIAELELSFRNYAFTRELKYKDQFQIISADVSRELVVLKHLTSDNQH